MMYVTAPTFEHYFQPETVEEAVSLLIRHGKEARLLAGGTDLFNLMRNRTLVLRCIIDITKVAGLNYVKVDEAGTLRIGALATVKTVAESKAVQQGWQLLREAILRMGMTQLRNMGTVAGNICRASPSADSAPALLVLDASVEIRGTKTRVVSLPEFFTGPGSTVLTDSELVTEIRVPKVVAGAGTAFLKLTRVAEDLAKVNVAVLVVAKNGVCQDARIALGGVAPTPIRAKKAEQVLKGNRFDDKLIERAAKTAADETRPITDLRSTAEYRKELSKVLVSRALKAAWEKTQGKKGG